MKNLYLITPINFEWDYDTYDSAVVCAESEEQAQGIHPRGSDSSADWDGSTWAKSPKFVRAELIGTAADEIELGSVVVASFNAG